MCVDVFVCVHVFVCVCACVCVGVCAHECVCVCVGVTMGVCMCLCVHIHAFACVSRCVCMHACMCTCVSVCMRVSVSCLGMMERGGQGREKELDLLSHCWKGGVGGGQNIFTSFYAGVWIPSWVGKRGNVQSTGWG